MSNKVVIHREDKTVIKGFTYDFAHGKDILHVTTSDDKGQNSTVEVSLDNIKALFFVKDLAGNKEYEEKKSTEFSAPGAKKIRIKFGDGEVMVGSTITYNSKRKGFFITPSDANSNNIRAYIPLKALSNVEIIL
ncbi:MAG: hypothetical protein ABH868_01265 [bacterium]